MDEHGIREVCRAFGLGYTGPYDGSGYGRHMNISCPFAATGNHDDPRDSNYSFSVQVRDGMSLCKCWSSNCQKTGSLWWIVREAAKARGNPEHLVELARKIEKQERPDWKSRCQSVKRHRYDYADEDHDAVEDMSDIFDSFVDLTDECWQYLAEVRGIDEQTAEAFMLRWDQRRKRIVFPIISTKGEIVGFSGGAISNNVLPKYKVYEGSPKSSFMFGEQFLTEGCIPVQVEGNFDVLAIHQATRNVEEPYVPLASLGSGFSEDYVETIRSFSPSRYIVFPDADDAGEVWALKVYDYMKRECPMLAQPNVRGEDPGDMLDGDIIKALEEARTILGRPKISCLNS